MNRIKLREEIEYCGGEGSGNFGHAGRPGEIGGSGTGGGGADSGKIISRLKTFYKNEERGTPHHPDDLQELAYDLADVIETGGNNWTPYGKWIFSGDSEKDADVLRSNPNSIAIDTALNGLHQMLLDELDYSGESSTEMLDLDMNLKEYILSRNENNFPIQHINNEFQLRRERHKEQGMK